MRSELGTAQPQLVFESSIFYVLILSDENTSDEFNNVFLDLESVHLSHKAMTTQPQLVFNFALVGAK